MKTPALLLLLLACSRNEVAFDTLETARAQAKDNALWNAQSFRSADPRFAGLDIIIRGDSTQAPDCPQGDGWSSVDFISKDKSKIEHTKCSTVSASVGCMTSADFESKPYASEEGKCAPLTKVPFPFRKIAQ